MNIVFVGANQFGYRCLEAIQAMPEMSVTGVVTNPETFSISYRPEGVKNVRHVDFYPFARAHDIPVFEMTGKMTDPVLLGQIKAWMPDLIVVVGWYHMVPRAIRDIAPVVGMHGSLLPDYSGGAPLVWAIINGETKTGITLFQMDQGVDSGPVIGQTEVPILFEDTIATLYAKIEDAGLKLLLENLPEIENGTAVYTTQDESRRRIMPQRSPEDGVIDWSWTAERVYNFIRAQTRPYPGAFTWLGDNKLTLWQASLYDDAEGCQWLDGGLVIPCGGGKAIYATAFSLDGEGVSPGELKVRFPEPGNLLVSKPVFQS